MSTRAQLVCQQPENIDRIALDKYEHLNRKYFHNRGLISLLQQLHDELDAAVFDAYHWPPNLTDDQLLQNLVTINHTRALEEQSGLIKYLRPDFQHPA